MLAAAPKRKRSGITPDSCGKETGALAACPGHIATKRRRALDEGWDAAQEAGNSDTHPVNLG